MLMSPLIIFTSSGSSSTEVDRSHAPNPVSRSSSAAASVFLFLLCHCPELIDRKDLFIQPRALLPKDHRAAEPEANKYRDDQKQRGDSTISAMSASSRSIGRLTYLS